MLKKQVRPKLGIGKGNSVREDSSKKGNFFRN
jgi:hypothetical protein